MSDHIKNLRIITEEFGVGFIQSNDQIRYKCPFCEKRRGKADEDYKMYVSLENLGFYCFKCNAKGRLRRKNRDALGIYQYVQNMVESELPLDDSEDENMFYVPSLQIPKDSMAMNYLVSRGLTQDDIEFYHIRLGNGKLFGRVVVPNELYGESWTDMYSARSYLGQTPKYKNPEGAKKTSSVFNLHNLKEGDECYVVEGVFTAIAAGRNAVAIYGSHPSEEQIVKIKNKNFSRIFCVLDNDPAGQRGQAELSEMLYTHCDSGTEILLVKMPENTDAADMGTTAFHEYVSTHNKRYQGKSVFSKIQELLMED